MRKRLTYRLNQWRLRRPFLVPALERVAPFYAVFFILFFVVFALVFPIQSAVMAWSIVAFLVAFIYDWLLETNDMFLRSRERWRW